MWTLHISRDINRLWKLLEVSCNELDLLLAQHTSEVGAGNTFTEYVAALRKRETLKNDVTGRERKAAIQEQLAMYVALQPSGTNQLGPSLSIPR